MFDVTRYSRATFVSIVVLTATKHEVRRCRRENESCNLSCNAADTRTIALASELP